MLRVVPNTKRRELGEASKCDVAFKSVDFLRATHTSASLFVSATGGIEYMECLGTFGEVVCAMSRSNFCSKFASSVHVGMQMNCKKPTCPFASTKPSRSQRGDTLRPNAFSSSPCAWNSCTTRSDHFSCRSHAFAECPMSAERNSIDTACCWSFGFPIVSNDSDPNRKRKAAKSSKCFCVSVPRINTIIRCRNFSDSSACKADNTFIRPLPSPYSLSNKRTSVAA
mmetsp:Transcript_17425/g.47612  ORF Transcript_17425/g.47612 Transcript_17425/m.47612 type:complete len:225 (-) Transcript_17425:1037-1711(-)